LAFEFESVVAAGSAAGRDRFADRFDRSEEDARFLSNEGRSADCAKETVAMSEARIATQAFVDIPIRNILFLFIASFPHVSTGN
jgi:cytochrome c-type biogenesis protein CcmH/NrfF